MKRLLTLLFVLVAAVVSAGGPVIPPDVSNVTGLVASYANIDGSNIIATSAFGAAIGQANQEKITVDSAGNASFPGALSVSGVANMAYAETQSRFFGGAGVGNTGESSNGFGRDSLGGNSGGYSSAFGSLAMGGSSSGVTSNGFGYATLYTNSGARSNAMGHLAGYENSGSDSNFHGHSTGGNNTGENSNGFGSFALNYNVGANSNAFGANSLRQNNWPNVIGIGHKAATSFVANAATAKTFTNAEIDPIAHTITIGVGHGFGSSGKINLIYNKTAGTTDPTGLADGTIYQFTLNSATVIYLVGLTAVSSDGAFSGTLTNSVDIHNSVAIGVDVNATKPHQVVLCAPDTVETLLSAGTCIATTTLMAGYALTVATGSAGSIWAEGEIKANSLNVVATSAFTATIGCPQIKFKTITWIASSSDLLIPHGLDLSKILGVTVMGSDSAGQLIDTTYGPVNGIQQYLFSWFITATNIDIRMANAVNLHTYPMKALIWYTE